MLDIKRLSEHERGSCPFYILDANIWIAHFEQIEDKMSPYLDFVSSLVNISRYWGTNKAKFQYNSKVIVTASIFNEVLNVRFKLKARKLRVADKDFKQGYRDTATYIEDRKRFLKEWKDMSSIIEVRDEPFKDFYGGGKIWDLPNSCDVNDWLHAFCAETYHVPLVTHDKDFNIEGISILTENLNLLKSWA